MTICKGAPTRKRKISFNTPSERVFVSALKKPRIANAGGPSQTTTVAAPLAKTAAKTIDLTNSPARILMPEGSREVYSDWNEEFVMYKKV